MYNCNGTCREEGVVAADGIVDVDDAGSWLGNKKSNTKLFKVYQML